MIQWAENSDLNRCNSYISTVCHNSHYTICGIDTVPGHVGEEEVCGLGLRLLVAYATNGFSSLCYQTICIYVWKAVPRIDSAKCCKLWWKVKIWRSWEAKKLTSIWSDSWRLSRGHVKLPSIGSFYISIGSSGLFWDSHHVVFRKYYLVAEIWELSPQVRHMQWQWQAHSSRIEHGIVVLQMGGP